MKNSLLSLSLVAAGVLAGAAVPSVSFAAPQACVNTLIADLNNVSPLALRINLVVQRRDNSWVSFSTGIMSLNSSGNPTVSMTQQFSDRFVPNSGQNFNTNDRDSHTLTINNSTGVITIVNQTWNFTTTLTPTCNGSVILASEGSNVYSISHSTRGVGTL